MSFRPEQPNRFYKICDISLIAGYHVIMIIAIAAGDVEGYLHLRLLVFIPSSKSIELKFHHDHWRAVSIESQRLLTYFLQRSSRDRVYQWKHLKQHYMYGSIAQISR